MTEIATKKEMKDTGLQPSSVQIKAWANSTEDSELDPAALAKLGIFAQNCLEFDGDQFIFYAQLPGEFCKRPDGAQWRYAL